MPTKIQLDVSSPCHEDWNQMTDAEKGKFCNSCQKHVVDFTGMSDEQLIAFFRKPTSGSVCGRFMSDQLRRDIALPKKRIPWFKYFFQFALPAFVLSLKAKGQMSSTKVIGDTVITYVSLIPSVHKELPELLIKSRTINGRVIDINDHPVPFASIIVGDRGIGFAADSNGYFQLDRSWLTGSSSIMISSVGFESKTIAVNTILFNKELIVRMNVQNELDEVVVKSFGSYKWFTGRLGGLSFVVSIPAINAVVSSLVTQDSVKVYPNPVSSGNPVTIEVLKSGKQQTTVEVFSASGQAVYSTQINMNSNAWKASVSLPKLTPGVYVMRISRGENKKPYSTKMVIQ